MFNLAFDYGPADPGCVYQTQGVAPNTVPPQICDDQAGNYIMIAAIIVVVAFVVAVGMYLYRQKRHKRK